MMMKMMVQMTKVMTRDLGVMVMDLGAMDEAVVGSLIVTKARGVGSNGQLGQYLPLRTLVCRCWRLDM